MHLCSCVETLAVIGAEDIFGRLRVFSVSWRTSILPGVLASQGFLLRVAPRFHITPDRVTWHTLELGPSTAKMELLLPQASAMYLHG